MAWSVARHRGRWRHFRVRTSNIMPKAGLFPPALSLFRTHFCSKRASSLPEIIWILDKEPAQMIAMALQICLSKHTLITDPHTIINLSRQR
jgi:hypothetical protein